MNILKIKKYSKIAINKITSSLGSSIYERTGLLLPKPTKVYYMISNKCNFRCEMCPQWKDGLIENINDYISENRIKELIDEMHKIRIGEFGISGGEPMIYKDKVMRLLEYANKKRIYTHFVTNGSLITDDTLSEYNKIGGGHISLSLDASEDKHDKLRGFKGAYANVIKVIDLFKVNNYKNINLKINITMSNQNIDEIMSIVFKAKDIGAVVFIQPYDTYDYGNKDIKYREEKYPLWVKRENYKKLEKLISELIKFKKENSGVLLNDLNHIKAFYDYFASSDFSPKCYAPMDQITINPFGDIILCKFGKIFNLKKNNLKEYLYSKKRKDVISASLKCKEGCLLGCMFKPSLYSLIKDGSKQFIKLIK